MVYGDADDIIFISKYRDNQLHDASSFFKNLVGGLLENRCWFFEKHTHLLKDADEEDVCNGFIESLLVKEG